MFGHEKFGAYRFAIEFAAEAARIIEKLPPGYAKLADQLRRASSSVALTIAEGSGKTSRAERNHCYTVARGEAMESAAIVDVLECSHVIESDTARRAKELLENAVAILTSVCRKKAGDHKTQVSRPGR